MGLCKCYTYLVAQACDHLGAQAWDQDVDHWAPLEIGALDQTQVHDLVRAPFLVWDHA